MPEPTPMKLLAAMTEGMEEALAVYMEEIVGDPGWVTPEDIEEAFRNAWMQAMNRSDIPSLRAKVKELEQTIEVMGDPSAPKHGW